METLFRRISLIWVTVFLLLPTLAIAQDISLASGGADQIWQGTQPGEQVGVWMDVGDVSGDARRDLIVGAPGTGSMIGKVYILFGGPDPTQTTVSLANAHVFITGATAGDRFGAATANGNILSLENTNPKDVVIGAPGANGGAGAVYLFSPGTGWTEGTSLTTSDAVLTIVGAPGDQLGTALATGDLDGDGHREIIIGAPGNNRVYVIKGGASMSGTIDLGSSPSSAAAMFSAPGIGSVLAAGDITGDGLYDVLMGAPTQNIVYGAVGAQGAIPTQATLSFSGVNAGDEAGTSIRFLDIDFDGHQDVAIGAPGAGGPGGRTGCGVVYLFFGPVSAAAHSLAEANVVFYGAQANDHLGAGMAAGNVNRDVYSSLIMLASGGSSGAGELDVYYGRARSSIGTVSGSQRIVDFAVTGEASRRIFGDPAAGPISAVIAYEVTGEGARDIIVGVPTVNSGAGEIFYTISPRLLISQSTESLVAKAGSSATSSTAVSVTNPSVVVIGWQATSTASWLSASPANGSIDQTHPGSFYVVASTAGLAGGTYTGTINVSATTPDLIETLPITVTLTVSDARLSIDTPADGATVSNGFQLAGWAVDLGASSGTGVTNVQAYAYPSGGGSPIYLGTATYGGARSDVGSLYGSQFTNSAYSMTVGNLTPGASYEIAVFVKSSVTNSFANAKTINVSVAASSPAAGPTPTDPNPAPPADPGPSTSPSPTPSGPTADTRVAVNRTGLYFGATSSSVRTGAQTVTVTFTSGTDTWTASSNVPWLTISPASGSGNGTFSVTATANTPATMTGTITVTAPGVANSPLSIPVTFTWLTSPTPANGYVDTPVDNATGVVGSLAWTGWAIDDIGVTQVTLWRDPVAGETVSSANGKVFIGNAVQVDGVRPDVESLYNAPYNYQAGWGYMLLTNLLPNQGNGSYTLYAYADDVDGHRTLLGKRTITCDNAHATAPFGTIDTPAQGATVSGTSYVNWGWALGAQSNTIPTDGSTITVYIDGVAMGHPTYNVARSDIQTLFPGHANTNGAVGYFTFDTTKLTNGVHTIVWGVTDAAGNAEGLGSRYFTVLNTSSAMLAPAASTLTTSTMNAPSAPTTTVQAAPAAGSQTGQPVSSLDQVPTTSEPTYVQKGYTSDAPLQIADSTATGSSVTAEELGLIRLTIGSPVVDPAGGYEGYLVKGGQLAPLPPGTFLDQRSGQFSWQPSVGVIGTYDFEFVRTEYGVRTRIPMTVVITPRQHDNEMLLPSRTIRY